MAPQRLFKVLSLLALTAFSGVLASPHHARRHHPNCVANPTLEICHNSRSYGRDVSHRDNAPAQLTNGERLARHLPLKPPTRRSSARRASASPSVQPRSNRGYIEALAVDDHGKPTRVLGYVSKTTFKHTQYIVRPSIEDALLVAPNGEHGLVTLNSDISSPAFLGLVQGRGDTPSGLASGNSNYLYLASTDQTSPKAKPQRVKNSFDSVPGGPFPAESAVWTRDPATNILKAQWVNSDGSTPPTLAFLQGSAIYFSADPQAFQQAHSGPIQKISLVYIAA
ncbi:hypothetical protein R3P38DRAFT_604187 [Favolaschia claudopus]|uniref:Phytase-like domain-containing protein n=1 Tax=Favolaschia claudopus TaxID=2862362 RepID=A0AAW0C8L1_9AGAR